MRRAIAFPLAAPALVALLSLAGCDASGGTQGGQLLSPDPCDLTNGGHTWSDLYTCYFGPTGKANCSAQAQCHASLAGTGAITSGFVCGTTKEGCWFSMTHPEYILEGVFPLTTCDAGAAEIDGSCPTADLDAGPDAAPLCSCFKPTPLVPTGGVGDPTTTTLWPALQKAAGGCTSGLCNNMPCGNLAQNCQPGTAAYTFTSDDLARISAWIREGAQDN
jgi:hypothetical protein